MPKLTILVGAPFTGKTTWAQQYINTNFEGNGENTYRVDPEDIRSMLKGTPQLTPAGEFIVRQTIERAIEVALQSEMNVIYDARNCKASILHALVDKWKYYADIEFQCFEASLDAMKKKNQLYAIDNRIHPMDDKTLTVFYNGYQNLKPIFSFNPIKRVESDG